MRVSEKGDEAVLRRKHYAISVTLLPGENGSKLQQHSWYLNYAIHQKTSSLHLGATAHKNPCHNLGVTKHKSVTLSPWDTTVWWWCSPRSLQADQRYRSKIAKKTTENPYGIKLKHAHEANGISHKRNCNNHSHVGGPGNGLFAVW